MTTSEPDFLLNRPGALIAALPAVLGFVPEKSLVLVTLDRGEMGAVMRVDLSPRLADTVGHIAEVAAAARPDAAIAVIVDAEGALCPMCNEDYRELAAGADGCACAARALRSGGARRRPDRGRRPLALRRRVRGSVAPSTTRSRRRWRWPPCSTGAGSIGAARICRQVIEVNGHRARSAARAADPHAAQGAWRRAMTSSRARRRRDCDGRPVESVRRRGAV